MATPDASPCHTGAATPTSSPSPLPEGIMVPELIITRRTRTQSMSGRIEDRVVEGNVKFFCRSKGHGFIEVQGAAPVFMHISDIDGEYIPRKGDRVRFRMCPMPPKFDKFQAVHIAIVDFTPEVHHRWCEKETLQELEEDRAAMQEENQMNESLNGSGRVPVDV